jgi:formimidoylglutamate deiminase
MVVFSLNRSAVRDVVVNGKAVIGDGKHPLEEDIVSRYNEVRKKICLNDNLQGAWQ